MEYGKQLQKKYPEDPLLLRIMGELSLYALENAQAAVFYLKQSLHFGKDDAECVRESWYLLERCYVYLGEKENAKRSFARYLDACRDGEGSLKKYEEFYGESRKRKFRLGCACWFAGEYEKAKTYFKQVEKEDGRCDGCPRSGCMKGQLARAMLYFISGEKQKALQIYEAARKEAPHDLEYRFEYKQMKKLEEQL